MAPHESTFKMVLHSQGALGIISRWRDKVPVDFVKLPHPRELVLCQIFNHSSPTGKEILSNLLGLPPPPPPPPPGT